MVRLESERRALIQKVPLFLVVVKTIVDNIKTSS